MLIDTLVNAMGDRWPDKLKPDLRLIVEAAFERALTQLDNHFVGDGEVVIGGKSYVQEKFLGQGGFGTVYMYKAKDGEDRIALKVQNMNDEGIDILGNVRPTRVDPRLQQLLRDEVEYLHGMNNTTVKMLGVVRGPGSVTGIVLDYAPGGDLTHMIRNIDQAEARGEISTRTAMRLRITSSRIFARARAPSRKSGRRLVLQKDAIFLMVHGTKDRGTIFPSIRNRSHFRPFSANFWVLVGFTPCLR